MEKKQKTVSIVWWGIGWLASAILLAKAWYKVSLYEKNECLGGRASILHKNGYTFDMWPSRYLMPDIFEEFFESIGEDIHDHLDLQRLSPSYRVFYEDKWINNQWINNKIEITKHNWKICCNNIWLFWYNNTEEKFRNGVLAVIKNIQTGKFLFQIKKKAHHVITLCGWWIEEWENLEDTIIREITEETGLVKSNIITKLWDSTYLRYRKWDDNLFGTNDFYYIEVESDLTDWVSQEEQEINWNIWLDEDEVLKSITFYSHLIGWFRFLERRDWKKDYNKADKIFIEHCENEGFIYWKGGLNFLDIYSDPQRMSDTFESIETWSGKQFLTFLERAKTQYEIGMEFCKKNYDSVFDFFRRDIMRKGIKLNIRTTINKYVARFFKNQLIRKIMQYTTVFLGTAPKQTPALYNIMSHCDFGMGVRYPKWGIHEIAKALHAIGLKHGVEYHLNTEVVWCEIEDKQIKNLTKRNWKALSSDIYLINADMAWFETQIIPNQYQTYPKSYRDKKIFAPSGFIIYAGINKKLPKLDHHNLYFCEDRDKNFWQIFDTKELPDNPSIYVSKITHTDPTMAPEWCENLFILVPIPNGIKITDNQKEQYKNMVRWIVEQMADEDIVWHIDTEEIFTVDNFKSRYNSWNWTALGLAHPIMQTAVFRPNNISKKLDNLFYVWHNTNPWIGVPMVLISAQLALARILKYN